MVLNVVSLVVFLVLTFGIGRYASARVKNMDDYVVASGKLGPIAIICTQIATWCGAGCLIGHVANGYLNGVSVIASIFSCGLGALIASLLFSKWLRKQKWRTMSDWACNIYGESKYIRVLVSILHVILYMSWVVAQIALCGTMFANLLGLPSWVGVVVCGTLICLLTTTGGMVGVAWMDTVHQILIVIAFVLISFFAAKLTNGFSIVTPQNLGVEFFNFSLPNNLWFVSTLLCTTCASIFAQTAIQRVWASRDLKTARAGLFGSFVAAAVIAILVVYIGLSARALNLDVTSANGAVYALINQMPKWVSPIFIIGVLGAAFSTTDSALNSASSNVAEDVYRKVINTKADDKQTLKVAKIVTVVLSVIGIVLAIKPLTLISYMFKVGYTIITGGIVVPMFLGMYWKKATREAAIVSMTVGSIVAICFECIPGLNTLIGGGTIPSVAISLIIMIVGSLVTKTHCGDAIHRPEIEAPKQNSFSEA